MSESDGLVRVFGVNWSWLGTVLGDRVLENYSSLIYRSTAAPALAQVVGDSGNIRKAAGGNSKIWWLESRATLEGERRSMDLNGIEMSSCFSNPRRTVQLS